MDGSECIVLGSDAKAVISEELCTGCGICIKKCPFEAITILNIAEEIGEDKIHQYGINTFRLYRLPTPRKGSVVGLVGKNGVGKTTTLNILSGILKPNLGRYESPPGWDDILQEFGGTELKTHFEKISAGQLKVSLKPQAVYKVAEVWKGEASSLLKKVDERNAYSDLVDSLNLRECISKNVSELSGGELQRLTVAVAASKNADIYLFDEPSSYNDVYQRLAVAKVIQGLADMGKSIILVEHDLTFLDYLSENIHVLYGEPGVYGIVSSVLTARTGINVLLDGYLPTENVRFRDRRVNFEVFAPMGGEVELPEIVKYEELTKSFPGFTLKVEASSIRQGQVIGVIGANALGKTTYLKIIAGIEKSDKGEVFSGAKISYKPQYLSSDYDGDVKTFLWGVAGDKVDDPTFQSSLVEPLGMHKLFEKNVKTLSGGELQKVAILSCLIRNADIYALDEPSAFIDVEDRLTFARAIQKFVKSQGKTALIVDHDIQMVDITSDSLMIFTGVPGESGFASAPQTKEKGMNSFLESLGITYRRDIETGRPRVNKPGSKLDREQKDAGRYYYLAKVAEQAQA
jgi:ATP-binding cassette subfamily E protein 1